MNPKIATLRVDEKCYIIFFTVIVIDWLLRSTTSNLVWESYISHQPLSQLPWQIDYLPIIYFPKSQRISCSCGRGEVLAMPKASLVPPHPHWFSYAKSLSGSKAPFRTTNFLWRQSFVTICLKFFWYGQYFCVKEKSEKDMKRGSEV